MVAARVTGGGIGVRNRAIEDDRLASYKELYAKHGAGRTNLAYGYALRTE